jgi:hypothetical protein
MHNVTYNIRILLRLSLQFQLLERKWSSGDNTVIDRDKVKGTHTHTSSHIWG